MPNRLKEVLDDIIATEVMRKWYTDQSVTQSNRAAANNYLLARVSALPPKADIRQPQQDIR
jgi:hypothetical protein